MGEQVQVPMRLELNLHKFKAGGIGSFESKTVLLGYDPSVVVQMSMANDGKTVVLHVDSTGFEKDELAEFFNTLSELTKEGVVK